MKLSALSERISNTPFRGRRRLVALAGPPASGKSTLSHALASSVAKACVVPMDGFHLDNTRLREAGTLARKGAPHTFDVAGFKHLIDRLGREEEVIYPTFDRALDKAIAGVGGVGPEIETVIVEGNYVLLDQPVWRDLQAFWDISIRLTTPMDDLRARLLERWLGHGYSPDEARIKAEENDLPNAELVETASLPADITLSEIEDLIL